MQSINVKAHSLISVLIWVQFFFLAMLTVLLYDHLLTLPEEVSSIIKGVQNAEFMNTQCAPLQKVATVWKKKKTYGSAALSTIWF